MMYSHRIVTEMHPAAPTNAHNSHQYESDETNAFEEGALSDAGEITD